MVAAILKVGIEYYDGDDKHGAIVKKGKIGPNYFRFKNNGSEYFHRAKQDIHIFNNQIIPNMNILKRLFVIANTLFRLEAVLADHQGQDMMPFTIRDLPEAAPHRDWLKGEVSDLSFLSDIQDQWAWNIYLTQPISGGETCIYNEQDPSNLIANTAKVSCLPKLGNLLFFRSTNVHEVKATEGDRYTLSGFCGPTSNGKLLFWV